MEDNHSNEEFEKGSRDAKAAAGKLGEKAAKKIASKIAEKETTQAFISSLITGGLSGVITTFLIPLLVVFLILTVVPIGIVSVISLIQGKDVSVELTTDKVEESTKTFFEEEITGNKKNISDILNSEYGYKNFNGKLPNSSGFGEYDKETNSITYQADTYDITFKFTPDAGLIAKSASAYASAVDGVLAYYTQDASVYDERIKYKDDGTPYYDYEGLDISDTSNFIQEDSRSDGTFTDPYDDQTYKTESIELSPKVYEDVKESLEALDVNSDTFADNVAEYGSEYFMLELDENKWTWNVHTATFYEHTTVTKYRLVDYKGNSCKENQKGCTLEPYEEPVTIEHEGLQGEVLIPIYADFTFYKADEVEELKSSLIGQKACKLDNEEESKGLSTCDKFGANQLVETTLYNYFTTTMQLYGVTDYSFFGGNMYSYQGISGVVVYTGDFDYGSYSGDVYLPTSTEGRKFWGHVKYLRQNGNIWGSANGYWCTAFAQAWIYDIYGINSCSEGSGSGNGSQFASVLASTHPDMFTLSLTPAAGGVASIFSGGDGHVVCIDEVNFEEGTITYSHCYGMTSNYKGQIQIRTTTTLKEFYSKWGRLQFAVPIQEQD